MDISFLFLTHIHIDLQRLTCEVVARQIDQATDPSTTYKYIQPEQKAIARIYTYVLKNSNTLTRAPPKMSFISKTNKKYVLSTCEEEKRIWVCEFISSLWFTTDGIFVFW